MEQVLRLLDDQRARFVEELATWVKIPAPKAWIDLENFHLGIKSAAHLYDELSRLEEQR